MAATPGSEAQRIAQLDQAALCNWFAALDPSDLGLTYQLRVTRLSS
jgi:hypothetical protein